jgi:hypothetical protein
MHGYLIEALFMFCRKKPSTQAGQIEVNVGEPNQTSSQPEITARTRKVCSLLIMYVIKI